MYVHQPRRTRAYSSISALKFALRNTDANGVQHGAGIVGAICDDDGGWERSAQR